MNKPLHKAELKLNELFHDLGLLEPYGKLDNPNYVTPYEKTIKIIAEALADQRTQLIQDITVGSIPNTTEYAKGWNDCRQEYGRIKKHFLDELIEGKE